MTSKTKFRVWSNHSKMFTTNIIRVPLILCRWITLLESPRPRLMIVYKCLPSVNGLYSVQFNPRTRLMIVYKCLPSVNGLFSVQLSPRPTLMIVYKCLPSVNSLFSVQFNSVRLNYSQKGKFHQTCSQKQTNRQTTARTTKKLKK